MGIGSLVCIASLLIGPVANALMRLGCQGKGTKDFSRQRLFSAISFENFCILTFEEKHFP